jgi:hypothetical protein
MFFDVSKSDVWLFVSVLVFTYCTQLGSHVKLRHLLYIFLKVNSIRRACVVYRYCAISGANRIFYQQLLTC